MNNADWTDETPTARLRNPLATIRPEPMRAPMYLASRPDVRFASESPTSRMMAVVS
jgi:hypothetical protein